MDFIQVPKSRIYKGDWELFAGLRLSKHEEKKKKKE
jgi:hypothetical protein